MKFAKYTILGIIVVTSITVGYKIFKDAHLQSKLYNKSIVLFSKPDIIMVGDSLTKRANIWPKWTGSFNYNILNLGHDGYRTEKVLQVVKEAIKYHPQLIFIMAGINDIANCETCTQQSFENYRQALELILDSKITPVIQLTLFRQNEPRPQHVVTLNRLLSEYAEKHQIDTINLNSTLSQGFSLIPRYTMDGVHLNSDGYKVWGDKLKQYLNRKPLHKKPANS